MYGLHINGLVSFTCYQCSAGNGLDALSHSTYATTKTVLSWTPVAGKANQTIDMQNTQTLAKHIQDTVEILVSPMPFGMSLALWSTAFCQVWYQVKPVLIHLSFARLLEKLTWGYLCVYFQLQLKQFYKTWSTVRVPFRGQTPQKINNYVRHGTKMVKYHFLETLWVDQNIWWVIATSIKRKSRYFILKMKKWLFLAKFAVPQF